MSGEDPERSKPQESTERRLRCKSLLCGSSSLPGHIWQPLTGADSAYWFIHVTLSAFIEAEKGEKKSPKKHIQTKLSGHSSSS